MLCKNINTVAMLMRDTLLRHFIWKTNAPQRSSEFCHIILYGQCFCHSVLLYGLTFVRTQTFVDCEFSHYLWFLLLWMHAGSLILEICTL